jgi:hypothetical protein
MTLKKTHLKWLETHGYENVVDEDYVTFRTQKSELPEIWIDREGKWCAQMLIETHLFSAISYASPGNAVKALQRLIEKTPDWEESAPHQCIEKEIARKKEADK